MSIITKPESQEPEPKKRARKFEDPTLRVERNSENEYEEERDEDDHH